VLFRFPVTLKESEPGGGKVNSRAAGFGKGADMKEEAPGGTGATVDPKW